MDALPFIQAALILAFFYRWWRTRRLPWSLAALNAAMVAFFTPLAAHLYAMPLEDKPLPQCEADQWVVLAGGIQGSHSQNDGVLRLHEDTIKRTYAAVTLAKKNNWPSLIVSGGGWGETTREAHEMAVLAEQLGYQGDIIEEDRSRNTFQNAANVAKLVESKASIGVVTSALHAPRAHWSFSQHFDQVCIVKSHFHSHDYLSLNPNLVRANLISANQVKRALHEWAGTLAYRFKY